MTVLVITPKMPSLSESKSDTSPILTSSVPTVIRARLLPKTHSPRNVRWFTLRCCAGLLQRRGKSRRDTMLIETRTATFRVDDIQAAYNDAVLSGRMPLAKEIARLWLGAIADQNPTTEKRPDQQRKSVLAVGR